MDKDIYFLRKTFELAQKAEGKTSPNPLVGAVLVRRGKIIASGYHKRAGLAHAEVEALRRAKGSLAQSTLYINIEPCCHFGKTPPCVDRIIASRIKRVVMASLDPNPLVKGRSVKRLKKAGVKVKVGLCQPQAQKLNEVFFKNMTVNLPYVAAKTAQSLDGKIATASGRSKWITGESSRRLSKRLRDKYDSVLVGVGTVASDNPGLDGAAKAPFKVVIDPCLRIPPNCKLIKENPSRLIIFTSLANQAKAWRMPDLVNIFFLQEQDNKFSLRAILKKLYQLGIMSVLVEGGAATLGGFFDAKLVDKLYFFLAPKIIGGTRALSSVGGEGVSSLASAPYIDDMQVEPLPDGLLISGYPR